MLINEARKRETYQKYAKYVYKAENAKSYAEVLMNKYLFEGKKEYFYEALEVTHAALRWYRISRKHFQTYISFYN